MSPSFSLWSLSVHRFPVSLGLQQSFMTLKSRSSLSERHRQMEERKRRGPQQLQEQYSHQDGPKIERSLLEINESWQELESDPGLFSLLSEDLGMPWMISILSRFCMKKLIFYCRCLQWDQTRSTFRRSWIFSQISKARSVKDEFMVLFFYICSRKVEASEHMTKS